MSHIILYPFMTDESQEIYILQPLVSSPLLGDKDIIYELVVIYQFKSPLFYNAASQGYIREMKILRNISLNKLIKYEILGTALIFAARTGQIESMKELRKWGVRSYGDLDSSLRYASFFNHIDCMKLLREWDSHLTLNYDAALNEAACGGSLRAMEELKKWGVTNFKNPLKHAIISSQYLAVEELKKWIKEKI